MFEILRKERRLLFCLFLLGVITRIFFLEKMQSHWDGPDYSLALFRYSFVQETPSPPGYPIYIGIGKFFHLFISDLHLSILMVSVLFAGIGVVVFYLTGKTLFNRTVGIISALIFFSAPTLFYFGITANPYGALPTTSAVLALIVFLILTKKATYGYALGLVFSFVIGFRPQDALFLTPLFLLGFFKLDRKQKYKTFFSTIIFSLVWIIPVTIAVGGIREYTNYVLHFF